MDAPATLSSAAVATSAPADILQAAEEALARDPRNVEAWLALSALQFAAAHYASATVAAREAVRIAPDFAEAHRMLAEASVLTSAPDSYAITAAREAVRLDPDNPRHHETLGDVLLMANRRSAAVGAFREASRLNPFGRRDVAARTTRMHARIATASLLVRVQAVTWVVIVSIGLALVSSAAPSPTALILTLVLAAALVGAALWRHSVVMRGSRLTLVAVLRADPLFAASAAATGLSLVLPGVAVVIPAAVATSMIGASGVLVIVALTLVGVRRVLK